MLETVAKNRILLTCTSTHSYVISKTVSWACHWLLLHLAILNYCLVCICSWTNLIWFRNIFNHIRIYICSFKLLLIESLWALVCTSSYRFGSRRNKQFVSTWQIICSFFSSVHFKNIINTYFGKEYHPSPSIYSM